MARVAITDSLITRIVCNVERSVRTRYGSVPSIESISGDAAETLMDIILPLSVQRDIERTTPEEYLSYSDNFKLMYAHMSEGVPVVTINNRLIISPKASPRCVYNHPAFSSLSLRNHHIITAARVTDTSLLPVALVDVFVKLNNRIDKLAEVREAVKRAGSTMDTFLRKHSSLKTALAEFGPALWEFIPEDVREAYERPTPKRESKDNKSSEIVDVSELVAVATVSRLKLSDKD